jgi:hypothetical protein
VKAAGGKVTRRGGGGCARKVSHLDRKPRTSVCAVIRYQGPRRSPVGCLSQAERVAGLSIAFENFVVILFSSRGDWNHEKGWLPLARSDRSEVAS